MGWMSQNVVATSQGAVVDDFSMSSNPFLPGALVGAQVGVRLGKLFLFNPYIIASGTFNSQCMPYKVTAVRMAGNLEGQSGTYCGGVDNSAPGFVSTPSGKSSGEYQLSSGFTTFGLKIVFVPLNMTFNVFQDTSKPSDINLKSLSVQVYAVSFAFGSK